MEGAAPPDCAWQPPTVPSVYVEYHRPSDAHQGYHVSDDPPELRSSLGKALSQEDWPKG